MADLSQTAANVKMVVGSNVQVGIAGEALTQGQPAYQSGEKWFRGRATTATLANCTRIVLTPAALDESVVLAKPGTEINLGATLAVGTVYAVSATLGAIAPIDDLVSTNFVTPLGVAKTSSLLIFNPQPSGIAKA
jgi:hypothetical protein